jgi:small-conductance mechanosensitive channel
VSEGVAPPALTWTGTNLDIVPGVSALLLDPFAHRMPRIWLQTWNIGSALMLLVTVVTALLAMPTPFQQIHGHPPNEWIADFPFVWLPAVLVLCAWSGHAVLFRRLLRTG